MKKKSKIWKLKWKWYLHFKKYIIVIHTHTILTSLVLTLIYNIDCVLLLYSTSQVQEERNRVVIEAEQSVQQSSAEDKSIVKDKLDKKLRELEDALKKARTKLNEV